MTLRNFLIIARLRHIFGVYICMNTRNITKTLPKSLIVDISEIYLAWFQCALIQKTNGFKRGLI